MDYLVISLTQACFSCMRRQASISNIDNIIESRTHLVQVDAPEVQSLGVVAQDTLKHSSAALRVT